MKIYFSIIPMMLYGGVCALAFPLSIEETDQLMGVVRSSELLKASEIIAGRIDAIKHINDDTIIRDGSPLTVSVSEASVEVFQVLEGKQTEKVQIEHVLSSKRVQLHDLEINKTYVFFLKKSVEAGFDPVSPYQFALETEIPIQPTDINRSVNDSLRNIAKENMAATNNSVAETWAQFLRGLHNNDDVIFWKNRIDDNRIAIRSIAIEVLAESAPQTPGLCLEVEKLLDYNTTFNNIFVRHHLFQLLPKLATKEDPSVMNLQNWMGKSEEFQKLALECIQETKDMRLIQDILHLMTTSKEEDIQYNCIKTLTVLSGSPHLISYTIFLKQRDHYIQEWQKIGEGLAK